MKFNIRENKLISLENYLCDAVKDFSVWYLSGSTVQSNSSEINLFSLILNFIQLASIKQINSICL